MKEILLMSGYLFVIVAVLWFVVIVLEKTLGKSVLTKKGEKNNKNRGVNEGDGFLKVLTAIVSGIEAYEESIFAVGRKKERVIYKRKEEKFSLWKTKGREK